MERLDIVADNLQQLLVAFVSANTPRGKQKPRMTPRPRPETAFERVNARRRMRQHRNLAGRVLARQPDAGQ